MWIALLCASALVIAIVVLRSRATQRDITLFLSIDAVRELINVSYTLQTDGNDLTLVGFAPSDEFAPMDLCARQPGDGPLPVTAVPETIAVAGDRLAVPRFKIKPRRAGILTVTYAVSSDRRAGNAHTGHAGVCFGLADSSFFATTGKRLFLLPKEAVHGDARFRVNVRRLPVGWRTVSDVAVTDPPQEATAYDSQQILASSLAFGAFAIDSLRLGPTTLRFAYPDTLLPETWQSVRSHLVNTMALIDSAIGRAGRGPYTTILLGRSREHGDEYDGSTSSLGQMATLLPLTSDGLRRFSRGAVEARIRRSRTRPFSSPSDYWLVDGIEHFVSWQAIVRAGLVTQDQVSAGLANRFLDLRGVEDLNRDLTDLYSRPVLPSRPERTIMPALALDVLDDALRRASDGRMTLLEALQRAQALGWGRAFWDVLGAELPRQTLRQFRDSLITGRLELVQDNWSVPLDPYGPPQRTGTALDTITVVYTGNTDGFLENCGCKTNQAGGIARRATAIRGLRRETDNRVILLDAGNAFIRPDAAHSLDDLMRLEEGLYLRIMDAMNYDAVTIGTSELAFGAQSFRERTAKLERLPYTSLNIPELRGSRVPERRDLRRVGHTFHVFGLLCEPLPLSVERTSFERTRQPRCEDPVRALTRAVSSMPLSSASTIIVIGNLRPDVIAKLVGAVPDVDLVISTGYFERDMDVQAKGGHARAAIGPGYIGGTLVGYTTESRYGLGALTLAITPRGDIAGFRAQSQFLFENVPDDRKSRATLDTFYGDVARLERTQATPMNLFPGDSARSRGSYLGAAACQSCHVTEFEQWSRTRHATAYKTLLEVHRHYAPGCVPCHVVGYGTKTGYRLGSQQETLANVQCEVCHGPGDRHVLEPSRVNIMKHVPEATCLACHNAEHSDHFVYSEQLPLITHRRMGGTVSARVTGSPP